MLMRRDFYSRNEVYIPRDPVSRGVVPDNYHIFAPSDAISICLYYESELNDEKVNVYFKFSKHDQCHLYIFLYFVDYTRSTQTLSVVSSIIDNYDFKKIGIHKI